MSSGHQDNIGSGLNNNNEEQQQTSLESATTTIVIPANLTVTTTTITGTSKVIAPSTLPLQNSTTNNNNNNNINVSTNNNSIQPNNIISGGSSASPLSTSVNNTQNIANTSNINISSTNNNTTITPNVTVTGSPSINRNLQTNTTASTTGHNNNNNTQLSASHNSNGSLTTSANTSTAQLSGSITIPTASTITSSGISNNNTQNEYQRVMENKKTLKKILKASKHWTEQGKSHFNSLYSFSDELVKQSEQLSSSKKDSNLSNALLSFGNTLKAINSVHDQMSNEVQDVFCTPLNNFVDYDFAEVTESNKRVTKAKEDYDTSLGKISSSIKKSKAGIDEVRLFHYEQELEKLKDVFENANKDLEVKLSELSHKNETKYLKSLVLFVNSQYHFYNRASKLFANLKPKLDEIEKYLEVVQPSKVVEGHLMKKSKQVMGGWNKCWYVLKDGMLYCYKGKKEFHPENALNILLCSVRLPQNTASLMISSPSTQQPSLQQSGKEKEKEKEKDTQQEQFRFEILHPRKKQPIVLQAENEEERDRWVKAIQDAISNSLNCQTVEKPSNSSFSVLGKSGMNQSQILGGGAGNNNNQSIQTDEVNQQVLRILQKVGGNTICADCGEANPDWASINLGIVICKVCSGVHRSLGTHISKVRSLTLDKWSPENILFMKEVGNTRFNLLFEHHKTDDNPKPQPQSDRTAKENWIRSKYKNKEYIIKSTLSQEELSKTLHKNIQEQKRDVLTYIKLLAQGADINYSSDEGRTPLHQSILKSDDVLIPELLLQNGADVTLVDSRGWTPMHYSAFFNRPRCANLLMKRGSDSIRNKCRDHLSRLPVDLATLNRSKETEKILRGEEIDTGLNMDNIENNSIPVFESTVPLSTDFPAVHQEILSDDEEDDNITAENVEHEITSWNQNNSENETNSIGRSSFSGTEGSSIQPTSQQEQSSTAPQNITPQITIQPTSSTNSLQQQQQLNSSSNNLNTSSNSNSSSSFTSLLSSNTANNSSIGNISNVSAQNSSNNLENDSNMNSSATTIDESSVTEKSSSSDKKSKVDKNNKDSAEYKASRPKSSKRRPSILGKGRNTLRMMKNKFKKDQSSDSEDDESESEEAEINVVAPPHPSSSPPQISHSQSHHTHLSSQQENVNKTSTASLSSSTNTSTNNLNNLTSHSSESSPILSSQKQPSSQHPSDKEFRKDSSSSLSSSQQRELPQHTQSSSSLTNDNNSEAIVESPTKNKQDSNKEAGNTSPTPFKMLLKKLKIKKKDSKSTIRDSSTEDIASASDLVDVPDNVSVGTNDDSLESDSSSSTKRSTISSTSSKKNKKSKSNFDLSSTEVTN